jgi:hypothetical protein
VSRQVLEAIARVLRLDDAEQAQLMRLAEPRLTRSRAGADWVGPLDPGLARMLRTIDHVPALVLGRHGEILARTELLPLVLGAKLPVGANFIRWLLTDPDARMRIVNWPEFAAGSVAGIRGEISRRPDAHRLRQLVNEPTADDPDIARWWDDYSVRDYASVRKRIQHPLCSEPWSSTSTCSPHRTTPTSNSSSTPANRTRERLRQSQRLPSAGK